jgi:hypothetical protein
MIAIKIMWHEPYMIDMEDLFLSILNLTLSLSHTHTLKYKQYLLLILSLEQIPQPQRNYSVSSFC